VFEQVTEGERGILVWEKSFFNDQFDGDQQYRDTEQECDVKINGIDL